MHNETSNTELITIEASQATWGSRLHKSDPDDVTPEGLIISFTKSDLENAMEALQKYPALFSISINAEIISNDFAGDIEGSHITIYNRAKTVYAKFSNGYTGTEYELEITSDVPTTGEPTPKRLSPFNPATCGRCFSLDTSHVPEVDLEQLIKKILEEPPFYFSELFIDFFVLPEFYNGGDIVGIGIRFFHQPWPVKDANKFFEVCELKSIPKSIAELILHAGMDGLDILTIDDNSQKVDGLPTFED